MNKRDILKGMVATAAGLVVPAHVLAESRYEFHQRVTGLKKPSQVNWPEAISSDGGVEWFGERSAAEVIDGNALAQAIGLNAGTSVQSTAGWLHVGLDRKELLIAKRCFRHSLSWNAINEAGAVYGEAVITLGDDQYKVRCLKGSNSETDMSDGDIHAKDPVQGKDSEWNRIFYRLVVDNFTNNTQPGIEKIAALKTSDIGIANMYTKCQEKNVGRGFYSISHFDSKWMSASWVASNVGWRPVLEKIQ